MDIIWLRCYFRSMLSARRRAFCEEYVVDLNGTQAAIRAGYEEASAGQEASRLLKNVKVRNFIAELQGKKRKLIEIKAEDIIEELHDIAFDEDNAMKDRLKALDLLARHKGLLTEKVEVSLDEGLAQRLSRLRKTGA